ncbi:hypothetical protein ACO1D2_20545 [Bacillus thuringiensis]|uniref:hypothetical protein n=1 Tax=Bacillus thuringiensis TaxID=1428 RepID=UPI003BF68207
MKNEIAIVLDTAKKIHPLLPDLIEEGMEFVPYLGSFLQFRKMNRFDRRIKENSKKLEKISKLCSDSLLSEELIKERVFPIVLSDLIEEHEDAKINLILNGFENVFIEEKTNESVVISYFDILRNLRYADIKRFLYFADETFDYPNYPDLSEERALTRNIDGKLGKLGLINISATWINLDGHDNDNDRENVSLTLYGTKFAEFILSDENVLSN